MTAFARPFAALAMCAFLAGCGSSNLAEVSGRVMLRGQPVTHGTIQFFPERSRPASAEIGPDGRYTLATFQSGDGALVGTHKVTITSSRSIPIGSHAANVDPEAPGVRYRREWDVPSQYAELATSGLTAEVQRGSNVIDFDLP